MVGSAKPLTRSIKRGTLRNIEIFDMTHYDIQHCLYDIQHYGVL